MNDCATRLFADDFDDGVIDTFQWQPYGMVSESGGDAVCTLGGGLVPASLSTGLYSARAHDLRDGRLFVEARQVLNTMTSAYVLFGAALDTGENRVYFREQAGILTFQWSLNSIDKTEFGLPYDSAVHRFWQIRETAGSTYWETSPDGMTWHVQASTPTLVPLAAAHTSMEVGTFQEEMAPGEARFDRLTGCRVVVDP